MYIQRRGGFAKPLYRRGFVHIYAHSVFFPTDTGELHNRNSFAKPLYRLPEFLIYLVRENTAVLIVK